MYGGVFIGYTAYVVTGQPPRVGSPPTAKWVLRLGRPVPLPAEPSHWPGILGSAAVTRGVPGEVRDPLELGSESLG